MGVGVLVSVCARGRKIALPFHFGVCCCRCVSQARYVDYIFIICMQICVYYLKRIQIWDKHANLFLVINLMFELCCFFGCLLLICFYFSLLFLSSSFVIHSSLYVHCTPFLRSAHRYLLIFFNLKEKGKNQKLVRLHVLLVCFSPLLLLLHFGFRVRYNVAAALFIRDTSILD